MFSNFTTCFASVSYPFGIVPDVRKPFDIPERNNIMPHK
jgi:hypothetical protein